MNNLLHVIKLERVSRHLVHICLIRYVRVLLLI